jgi:hypothetical protein
MAPGHRLASDAELGAQAPLALKVERHVVYWVAGAPPIGGEWRGRGRVLRAMTDRELGLGAVDWV